MKPLYSIDADGSCHRRPTTPAEDRELLIHQARVFIREVRARRATPFGVFLLASAGRCRREAAAIDLRPAQGRLL